MLAQLFLAFSCLTFAGSSTTKDVVETKQLATSIRKRKLVADHYREIDSTMSSPKQKSFKKLEEFTLVEKLGKGSFANVYKAFHSETKQFYAMKKLNSSELEDGEGTPSCMLREVAALKELNHPNVIK